MELLDQLKDAAVRIYGPSPGTGYLVTSTRVATCQHVVKSWDDEWQDVEVGEDRQLRRARVVKADAVTDCAVLELENPVDNSPLPLAKELVLSSVWWEGYGFPKAAQGVGLRICGEVLDKKNRDKMKREIIVLQAEAAGNAPLHGFSGSAVVVEGAVVGHLLGHIGDPDDRTRPAYNMIFAVPISGIRKLLDVPGEVKAIDPPVLVRTTRFIQVVAAELAVPGPSNAPEVLTLKAAETLIGQNRPDLAMQVLSSGCLENLRAAQLRARALSASNRLYEAIDLLEHLVASGANDTETLGLLAGRYKDLWRKTQNKADLLLSYETYAKSYALSNNPYVGINAAAMALLCGLRTTSIDVATKVTTALENSEDFGYWDLATMGEARLLCEDYDGARIWYRRASAAAHRLPQDIAIMRRQARLELEALGRPEKSFDDVLPVPRVLAFAGHMVDSADRYPPRFPESMIGYVRGEIQKALDGLGFVKPFATAARGSDILFLEEAVARDLAPIVVLPFPEKDFREVSMGGDWNRRFDRIHDRLEIQVLSPERPTDSRLRESFALSSIEVQRLTSDYAKRLDESPILLVVWDGKEIVDGPGGTGDAVRLWRTENVEPQVISVPETQWGAVRS
jgi:hypothetical protein